MLDLLVFTQYPRTYGPRRFKEEADKLGLSCKIKAYKYADLNDLPDAKYVIFREPTSSKNIYVFRDQILNYYVNKNSKILNKDSYTKWSILDKKTQHLEFKKGGIPTISELSSDTTNFPFIVKSKLGSHGDSVYKITCKEDLEKVLLRHKADDLLCQEFQNSGFDLRVIVIGGRVLGIMKRTPKDGEFLSNYSQGGSVEQLKIKNEELIIINNIATKTAEHFKLDYVGVDLMMGNDGEWKVLEVNRACQFKGFEQATAVNIASKVVQFLLN